MKNGFYDNPKKRDHGDHLAMLQHRQPSRIFMEKNSCCVFDDQLGVVYYELLKPNETITGTLYRTQLMRLSRALKEKRAKTHYYSRHDKIIVLHDNARHILRRRSKHSNEVLPHPPYSPDIAPFDYHLF